MEYCSAIFASAAPSQLRKLDTVQKISARIICRLPHAWCSLSTQSLHLESLESRRTNHIINIVESIMFAHCHPAPWAPIEIFPGRGKGERTWRAREREPITGVWGQSLWSGVRGRSPLKLNTLKHLHTLRSPKNCCQLSCLYAKTVQIWYQQ